MTAEDYTAQHCLSALYALVIRNVIASEEPMVLYHSETLVPIAWNEDTQNPTMSASGIMLHVMLTP